MGTLSAKRNISQETFYKWRSKYGGMEVNEARRMRAMDEENSRLKRVVVYEAVQIQILKEANAKSGEPFGQATGGEGGGGNGRRHDR